jgi:hypothetical protein
MPVEEKIQAERADIVTWSSRYPKEGQEYWDNRNLIFYTHTGTTY